VQQQQQQHRYPVDVCGPGGQFVRVCPQRDLREVQVMWYIPAGAMKHSRWGARGLPLEAASSGDLSKNQFGANLMSVVCMVTVQVPLLPRPTVSAAAAGAAVHPLCLFVQCEAVALGLTPVGP
jgi:hypothetical protein